MHLTEWNEPMYHGLFFHEGQWYSFRCVYTGSPAWTEKFQESQRTYGPENVEYVFWEGKDLVMSVSGIQDRMDREAALANQVQELWNTNKLPEAAGDQDRLHLTMGMRLLKEKNTKLRRREESFR